MTWWSGRLNELFSVLTDPGVFTDRESAYIPAKHHQGLLTVEQLFRRVSSVLTAHREAHARRVLLFTVLDTLDRLTNRSIDVLCSLPFADRTIANIGEQMPADVAAVLLPAAERTVLALAEL